MEPIGFLGCSGRTYYYQIMDLSPAAPPWSDEGGNYLFAKMTPSGLLIATWSPIYAGICKSFAIRMPGHPDWPVAQVKYGATHILGHLTPNEVEREAEERDMIASYNPPLNVQHRTGPTGFAAGSDDMGALDRLLLATGGKKSGGR